MIFFPEDKVLSVTPQSLRKRHFSLLFPMKIQVIWSIIVFRFPPPFVSVSSGNDKDGPVFLSSPKKYTGIFCPRHLSGRPLFFLVPCFRSHFCQSATLLLDHVPAYGLNAPHKLYLDRSLRSHPRFALSSPSPFPNRPVRTLWSIFLSLPPPRFPFGSSVCLFFFTSFQWCTR